MIAENPGGVARDDDTADTPPTVDHVVEVRGLAKQFDDVEGGVLQGIDLTVAENETVALLGPNGSGKTVAMACITGGLRQYTGDLSVFGATPTEVRDRFSLLLQGDMAIPELSGREAAEFFAALHPSATDGWRTIPETLGIAAELDRKIRNYSGGMTRKLELAVALSLDVPLYLLDEPTASLDMTTVEEFHGLLEERCEDGRTVVFTSHTPIDLAVADRVAFVRDGKITATGDPDELMAAVPRVLRVEGPTREFRQYVQHGRFFEGDGVCRGFLEADYVHVTE